MTQDQFSRWNASKVKARAEYTCQRCGSTENIQAHDPSGKHTDWRVGKALCGDCHWKEHPEKPPGLFAPSTHQPYWPNLSARSLARQFGCHNRTIIRAARRLSIPMGQALNEEDRERLRNNLGRHYGRKKIPQPPEPWEVRKKVTYATVKLRRVLLDMVRGAQRPSEPLSDTIAALIDPYRLQERIEEAKRREGKAPK